MTAAGAIVPHPWASAMSAVGRGAKSFPDTVHYCHRLHAVAAREAG
jgi:hypothetical protein